MSEPATAASVTEATFRDFASPFSDPLWLVTAEGVVVAANPAAAALVRRSAATLPGTPLVALAADEPARIARYLGMCARSRQMVPGALTLRAGDDAGGDITIPCRCDGAVIRPHSPASPALILLRCRPKDAGTSRFVALTEQIEALHREIARREDAERALREHAAHLSAMYEQTIVGIVQTDLTGRFLFANRRYCELVGRSEDELRTLRMQDISHPDDLPHNLRLLERARTDNVGFTIEKRYIRPDGTTVWVENSVSLVPGPAGESHGVLAVVRDTTEQKETELALRRQAGLLEQTHDAILVWELEGGLTYLNRAAEALFGWARTEAAGRRTDDLLQTRGAVSIADIKHRLYETGEWSGELVQRTRAGGEVVVETRMVLLHADGERPLVLETGRDVTDERRARTQLEAAQRMEAVGRLAGGVAHEINNALQGALGFSSFALKGLSPDDPVRDDVQQVLQATERAAVITQGLLAFSRRQMLQPADVSLGGIVEEFAPMLRQALGRDRELQVEVPPSPVVVHADRGQLEQVLLNLTLNARDAMEVGGHLTVRVGSLDLSDAERRQFGLSELGSGRVARLEVEDTGHGMDEATLPRVFEPFFTTKAPGQGAGLGLAVVYGIVHQSGGAITVRSAPGRGTTFIIYLSAVVAAAAPPGAVARVDVRGGAERILVVDDEPMVRQLASRLLKQAGYSVVTASDGAEALRSLEALGTQPRALNRPPVDLVVSDVVMPILSGRELGEALGQRYPGLPVLYMSGYPGPEIISRGLLAEGVEFVQKPFRPDHLLVKVRSLLDGIPTT